MEMTRRNFVAGAAGAAAATALAAGATVALADEAAETEAAAAETPAFLVKPEVPTDIVEERDCDVLVIGMGLAGTAAFKAAAEAGVTTIALEKQPEDSYSVIYMAGDFGVVGSQIQKDLGIEWAPKADIMNEMAKECGSRIDTWMMSYWYDHSGQDFDWFVEGADFEVLTGTAAEKQTDKEFYIRPKCFPKSENYDYHEEYIPYFHGTITTNPNMQWACQAAMDAGKAAGGEIIFGATGEQLIQDESGAVIGAYAQTEAGYIKVNAKQVVLTCGDYGANQEMKAYYAPEYVDYTGGVDTGDGHRMGIWAGGRMEEGPHAPMAHHMGAALGVDSYLQLNNLGKRFMNEDIPGQNLTQMLSRQPLASDPEKREADIRAYQIFDSKWPEQIADMPDGHGYTSHYVPDDQVDQYPLVLSGFGLGWTTQPDGRGLRGLQGRHPRGALRADGPARGDRHGRGRSATTSCAPTATTRTSAKCPSASSRWRTRRSTAAPSAPARSMLVMIGGLECDHDLHVVDADDNPIPGLFVAGNNQGRRFLVDYPVIVAGISLGTALTFGRLAGTNAAAAVTA